MMVVNQPANCAMWETPQTIRMRVIKTALSRSLPRVTTNRGALFRHSQREAPS